MNLERLETLCNTMTDSWGYSNIDIVFEGHAHDHIEAVLHEASHTVSLGLSLDALHPKVVSRAITALEDEHSDSLLGRHSRCATEEEARAWCIEWLVIERLGLNFEWGDVVEGAAVQGVEEDQLERWIDVTQMTQLADRVYAWLETLET